ncbi:hypothetical protein BLOT_011752 [Blomia tropicalis]|nr:hypothetical protein BLOT_011752 [Blomia tropicalis]
MFNVCKYFKLNSQAQMDNVPKRLNASKTSVMKRSSTSSSSSSSSNGNCDTHSRSKSKSHETIKNVDGLCVRHVSKKRYDYGLHTVTIDTSGRCVDPRIISEQWMNAWRDAEMSRQRFSVENVFRVDSVANIFLDLVRDFKENQLNERGLFATEDDLETPYSYIEILVEQTIAIVRSEPKMLMLNAPLYVIGDLQGNLCDLFLLESNFFRSVPILPHTVLFLGNYSGEFPNGIECILYLFALKVVMPNKIYLLRGRNEIRHAYDPLFRELSTKYGTTFGPKIYEQVHRAFDTFPVAALVEESVLCTHSGIPQLPPDRTLISELNGPNIAVQHRNPAETFPRGYELIVNVPLTYRATGEQRQNNHQNNHHTQAGFVAGHNQKFYFSRYAFSAFLENNGLDYLLRSHNPCEDGFAICFRYRCCTIFSCRKSSPILAVAQFNESRHKIRFIRIRADNPKTSTNKGGSAKGSSCSQSKSSE